MCKKYHFLYELQKWLVKYKSGRFADIKLNITMSIAHIFIKLNVIGIKN